MGLFAVKTLFWWILWNSVKEHQRKVQNRNSKNKKRQSDQNHTKHNLNLFKNPAKYENLRLWLFKYSTKKKKGNEKFVTARCQLAFVIIELRQPFHCLYFYYIQKEINFSFSRVVASFWGLFCACFLIQLKIDHHQRVSHALKFIILRQLVRRASIT